MRDLGTALAFFRWTSSTPFLKLVFAPASVTSVGVLVRLQLIGKLFRSEKSANNRICIRTVIPCNNHPSDPGAGSGRTDRLTINIARYDKSKKRKLIGQGCENVSKNYFFTAFYLLTSVRDF
jgi:hypothetical protein